MSAPRCILVCVGSELLRGKLNTHASHISLRLASIGLALNEENTVSDDLPEITRALQRAIDSFDVIFVSGGLGTTFDDVTREGASAATGHALKLSNALLRGIEKKFRKAKCHMPAAYVRESYLLEGAQVIPNEVGAAPGQWLEFDSKILILLPGPPRELNPMLEEFVLPRLRKLSTAKVHLEAHLHFVGVAEPVVDEKIRPIIAREQRGADRIQFTILAHLGLVDFDVFVASDHRGRARKTLDRIVRAVKKTVGPAWYGSDGDYPLEKVVGDRFRKQRATLAVAESCTGGMLASRLTDIPGSSDFLKAGVVTYADSAKMRELSVSKDLLQKQGAVSRPVAIAMARGIRERAGTTWGVGITGIAGPEGGTVKKPIGLVYIGLSSKTKTICKEYHFLGNRDAIRQRSVLAALDDLRQI